MTDDDFERLRVHLLTLRRKALSMLAERSGDHVADIGLVAMAADVQMCLMALDEERKANAEDPDADDEDEAGRSAYRV